MTIPTYYLSAYKLEQTRKTYNEFKASHNEKPLLSDVIRIEKNKRYKWACDNSLLRIRDTKNWKACTMAGLHSTDTIDYFYTCLPINGINSLVICRFNSNHTEMLLYSCPEWYPLNPIDREEAVNVLIDRIKKEDY